MKRQSGGGAGPALVCVVDDDAALRCAMLNLLEAEGYAAHAFDSGESLLAWPGLAGIDVAVFDVCLRGMDGFALRRSLAARGLAFPVLFVSGHLDAGMAERAAGADGAGLLGKPVDPDLLLGHIARALRARAQGGAS